MCSAKKSLNILFEDGKFILKIAHFRSIQVMFAFIKY